MKFFIATAFIASLAVTSAQFSGCSRTKFGIYANPTDCTKYVMCVAGAPVPISCPRGMNFDSRIGACSPFAKCKTVPVIVEEPVKEEPHHEEPIHEEPHYEEPVHEEPHHEEPIHEEPHHEEPVHEEPQHEEPKHEEPQHEEPKHEEPVEEPVGFSCPRSSGRFADVHNCKQYFQCKDGQSKLNKCPLNFRFSRSLGLCLPGIKCVEEKVEEPIHEEAHHEEPQHEEAHHEEPKHEEPQHEEPKHEEPQHEEPKHEEPKHEEPQHEEPQHEEPKHEEPKHEEPQQEEPHHEEPQQEEPHHEEPQHEEPHHEEPQHEEPHHEEPQHEEPKHEEEPITPVKFECKKSFGLFADGEDCHKYHMCVRGRAFTIVCPTDTNYDFINKHCMSITKARCMKKKEDVKVEEEEPVQEEKKFECPVEFGFFPTTANGKFIQCAHGVPHEMVCPANTEWNQEAQVCDHLRTIV